MCFNAAPSDVSPMHIPMILANPSSIASVAVKNETRKNKKAGRSKLRLERNPPKTPYAQVEGKKGGKKGNKRQPSLNTGSTGAGLSMPV